MIMTGLLILSSGFLLMTFATIQVVTPRARNLFYGWKLVGISTVAIALASSAESVTRPGVVGTLCLANSSFA